MNTTTTDQLEDIAAQFLIHGDFVEARPYGSGHINDTFAVTMNQGGTPVRYIFQRMNDYVFRDPPALMDNIRRVTEHQRAKLADAPDASRRSLQLIPARDSRSYYRAADGAYWRVYIFIEHAATYDIIETPEQAFEAASAFGTFQQTLADLPGERLNETIPDFHNTPKRYENFEAAQRADRCGRARNAAEEIAFAEKFAAMANTLTELHARGDIPERITHNDTKLNNVMIDDTSGKGICVIDLDTVMPGLSLYDFGDMVRSATNPAAEDEKDLNKVYMHMPTFDALVRGFLSAAGSILTEPEAAHMAFSGKLITYEIGLRFLTDYLEGDLYFKTDSEDHNLRRCRTQFRLVCSMEEQGKQMRQVVEKHRC